MHLFPTTTIYSFLYSALGISTWEHMCVCVCVTSSMLGKMTQRVMLAESDSDSPLCSKTCRNWIMMVLSSSLCFLMTESFPLGVGNLPSVFWNRALCQNLLTVNLPSISSYSVQGQLSYPFMRCSQDFRKKLRLGCAEFLSLFWKQTLIKPCVCENSVLLKAY